MTDLPAMRPNEVIAALRKAGYREDHQTGSHVIMYKRGCVPISVPKHNSALKKGTLHQIIRNAGLSVGRLPEAKVIETSLLCGPAGCIPAGPC